MLDKFNRRCDKILEESTGLGADMLKDPEPKASDYPSSDDGKTFICILKVGSGSDERLFCFKDLDNLVKKVFEMEGLKFEQNEAGDFIGLTDEGCDIMEGILDEPHTYEGRSGMKYEYICKKWSD